MDSSDRTTLCAPNRRRDAVWNGILEQYGSAEGVQSAVPPVTVRLCSAAPPRSFQDHKVSLRILKGRCMLRLAERVASVMSRRPVSRMAPGEVAQRGHHAGSPDLVWAVELSRGRRCHAASAATRFLSGGGPWWPDILGCRGGWAGWSRPVLRPRTVGCQPGRGCSARSASELDPVVRAPALR
jgi:hypothetical protein